MVKSREKGTLIIGKGGGSKKKKKMLVFSTTVSIGAKKRGLVGKKESDGIQFGGG